MTEVRWRRFHESVFRERFPAVTVRGRRAVPVAVEHAHAHRAHGRRVDVGTGTALGPQHGDTPERGEVLFRDLDIDAGAASEHEVLEWLRRVHAAEPALAAGGVLVLRHDDRCRRRPMAQSELARPRVRETDRHIVGLGQVCLLDGQLALRPM